VSNLAPTPLPQDSPQPAAEGAPPEIEVNCVSSGLVEAPVTRGDPLWADSPTRIITTAR